MAFLWTVYIIGALATAAIVSLSGAVLAGLGQANNREKIAVGISVVMISLLWPIAWLGVIIGKAFSGTKV
jgi:hypothetical protein